MQWTYPWAVILIISTLCACSLPHPLLRAAYRGDLATVKTIIDKAPHVHQSTVNNNGRGALHIAAMKGHVDVVRYLLSHGARIDEEDNYGFTALHAAVWKGRVDVVKYLMSQGADINDNRNAIGYTPLHIAARTGNAVLVRQLIDAGALTHSKSVNGSTALGYAKKYHQPDIMDMLTPD